MNIIRIATRQSKLAIWQSEWVATQLKKYYKDLEVVLVKITTKGDHILDQSLSKIGGKGLFVTELESALLDNTADIAVHSLKDMPVECSEHLELAVYCQREDFRDVLISKNHKNLASMPLSATIGTSSLRRAAQLKIYREDLVILPLRGNIDTRINKALDEATNFDGIILASAGVHRLDQHDLIRQYLPINNFLPAPGQGIVVIQCRKGDQKIKDMISKLSCKEATIAANAERAFNRVMGGSCQIPIAALAEFKNNDEIILHGQIASPDGRQHLKESIEGAAKLAVDLGERLAEDLLHAGASKIIDNISIVGKG